MSQNLEALEFASQKAAKACCVTDHWSYTCDDEGVITFTLEGPGGISVTSTRDLDEFLGADEYEQYDMCLYSISYAVHSFDFQNSLAEVYGVDEFHTDNFEATVLKTVGALVKASKFFDEVDFFVTRELFE